jgi:transcriptional regulator with XRE-family HTH domain
MIKRRQQLALTVGAAIKEARERKGLSKAAVGKALGVSRQAVGMWESGDNLPDLTRINALHELLGTDRNALRLSIAAILDHPKTDLSNSPEPKTVGDTEFLSVKPILDEEDDKFLIIGKSGEFAKRPPGLRPYDMVQGLVLDNVSMTPWRFPSDPVFYSLLRSPRIGDHCLVGFKSKVEPIDQVTEATPWSVKLLTGFNSESCRFKQYLPEKEITVDRREILTLYRVMEWTELYGPFPGGFPSTVD